MRRHRGLRVLKMVVWVVAVSALAAVVVMGLWNWLVPAIFGLRRIDFLQAWGLLVLAKILFGGFHGRPGRRGHWKQRMNERWESMTPEEREKLRERLRGRCGWGDVSGEPERP